MSNKKSRVDLFSWGSKQNAGVHNLGGDYLIWSSVMSLVLRVLAQAHEVHSKAHWPTVGVNPPETNLCMHFLDIYMDIFISNSYHLDIPTMSWDCLSWKHLYSSCLFTEPCILTPLPFLVFEKLLLLDDFPSMTI